MLNGWPSVRGGLASLVQVAAVPAGDVGVGREEVGGVDPGATPRGGVVQAGVVIRRPLGVLAPAGLRSAAETYSAFQLAPPSVDEWAKPRSVMMRLLALFD